MMNRMTRQPTRDDPLFPREDGGPGAPVYPLVRTGLLERLSADQDYAVLTLVAPPGYGKTVTLGSLYRAEGGSDSGAIWVEPRSSLSLAQTLATCVVGENYPTAADAGICLQQWVGTVDVATTVFIDRFEAFGERNEDGWFDALLNDSPACLRWKIASRFALPIDVLEHLLEGRLREVNYSDLAMSPQESRELLGTQLCQHLEPQDFDLLQEITEGWPAALRIIGQRLRASEHPRSLLKSFSELSPDFANYFDSRLLARLSDDERTLMLELALLPDFDAELCTRISALENPLSGLDRLKKTNCVAQSATGSGALRIHPLVRIHCRARARIYLPESHRTRILSTAGAWYESCGQWDRAIDVRVLAGEIERVVELLERHCELLARDQGQVLAMTRWVETLRSQNIEPGPRAHFWYLWALVFRRRYGVAESQIDALKQHLQRCADQGDAEAERLLSQVPIVQACIALYCDRLQQTYELANAWLEANPEGDPFHVGEAWGLQTLAHLEACRFAEARRCLHQAHAAFRQSGSRYGVGWMQLFDGLVALGDGDVASARGVLRVAMESLRADLGEDAPLLASMELICARASLDQGLDEEAESLLLSGLRVVQMHGYLDPLICGVYVGVALWTGNAQEATHMQHLRGLVGGYPSRLALMLSCWRVQALLRDGRQDEARELALEIGLDPEHGEPRFVLEDVARDSTCRHLYRATHIRCAIAFAALERAKKMLDKEIAAARSQNRTGDLVALLLDTMVIFSKSGNDKAARQALVQAVRLAARRKLLRPFLERSDSIAPLVLDTRMSDWGWADGEEKQMFSALCQGLPIAGARLQEALDDVGIKPELTAAVTHREIEFLRLIDLGLSNAQIAMRCELSVSTVKWHLYNLFGKLNAKNRSAAVAQAKALNLIN